MPACEGELSGRVAVVTGAGQGMGETITRTLAEAGAVVAAFDVNQDTGEASVEATVSDGLFVEFHSVDVSDSSQIRLAIEKVVARHGRLDIADACLWLASDRSSYVTGTTIHVDAGLAQAR